MHDTTPKRWTNEKEAKEQWAEEDRESYARISGSYPAERLDWE